MEDNKVYNYRWREPYNNIWHTTRCRVLEVLPKTLRIELLGFGKGGTRPYTMLKVQKKSVIDWKEPEPERTIDDSWKKWNYFD
jgi:hypothetical protein